MKAKLEPGRSLCEMTQPHNPVLQIPQAWHAITPIARFFDATCPDITTPAAELEEWLAWWMPAFRAAEGLSGASVSRMKSSGWWPPVLARGGKVPEVVANSKKGLLYWESRRRIDDRSRAYHWAIGNLLEANLDWIERARTRAAEGAAEHRASGLHSSPLDHWLRILAYPVEHVIETISYDSERMDYLRPYSPFTGVLPKSIRADILKAFSKPEANNFAESQIEMSN